LNLYEITLPVADNTGQPTKLVLAQWEQAALRIAGGFTLMSEPVRGAWRDPSGGKVYTDYVRIYRVGCEAPQLEALLGETFDLFPDQLAIFAACVGTAEVRERKDQRAIA